MPEFQPRVTNVRNWLEAQITSHDTYYYWYAEVINSLMDEINTSQDIIPVSQDIISEALASGVIAATSN